MKKLLFLMTVFALLCNTLSAQHLHRVNNNADFDADFTSLQDAVSAAADHDTIYVEGSATAYEGATIKKALTIIGPGFFLNENPETQANTTDANFSTGITFANGSEGSTIMGCKLEYTAVTIEVSDITVIRNYAYDIECTGNSSNILIAQNYVYRTINGGLAVLTNCIISNNIVRGSISMPVASGPLTISNNICFTTSYTYPIDVYNASIQNNILTYDYSMIGENTGNTFANNILASDGTNANGNQYNIDMEMVFADFDGSLEFSRDGKWELKEGSPAMGAGVSGADCGVFGGPAPYVLSGLPSLPHIYEANVPASATSESGLQVTIKVKR